MANYAVVDKDFLDDGLSRVADTIKTISENSEEMEFPDGFEERVNSIPDLFWKDQDILNIFTNNRSTFQSLKLPNSMTSIADYAFRGMSKLKISQLPDTIESIGHYAFQECLELGLTKLPENLKSIGNYAFRQASLEISALPEKLETIGNYAFLNRTFSIDSIPKSVKTMSTRCFEGCKQITSLTFKGTPDSIASDAFISCHNLTVINVPWADGEVANAPWGATNAKINYSYVGE